jgi:predicted SAM-dependent methyltransferase
VNGVGVGARRAAEGDLIMRLRTGARNLAKKLCDVTGVPRYFVREGSFELRMLGIRLYGLTPFRYRKIKKLERQRELRLIFGCGVTRYPGWVGVDCFRGESVDLLLDLRRPLPFANSSVDYCYSEHFLEHLYPDEARQHLEEVRRILRPGGVYRIVVPAGIRFAEKYLEGDTNFFALAHPWEERPLDAVYKIVNWNGQHRGLYDFAQIDYLAKEIGFVESRECHANQSPIPALRIDRNEPQRVAESLYVEIVKG